MKESEAAHEGKGDDDVAEDYIATVGDEPEPDPRPETEIFGQKTVYDLRAVDLNIKSRIVIPSGSIIEFDPDNNKACSPYVAIKVTYIRNSGEELGHRICAEVNAIAEALRENLDTGIFKVDSVGKNFRRVIASIKASDIRTGQTVDFKTGTEIRYRPDQRCWGVVIEAVEAAHPVKKGNLYCLSRTWFSRGTRSITARVSELPPAIAEIVEKQDAGKEASDAPAKTHYKSELLDVVVHDETPVKGAHSSGDKGERQDAEAKGPSKTVPKSNAAAKGPKKFDKKWLDGKRIKIDRDDLRSEIRSAEQTAFFFVPADRCKAGLLQFGNTMCAVVARGVGTGATSKSRRGTRRNGQTCYYAPENVLNGATPIDPPPYYDLSLAGRRSPIKKFGSLPVVAMMAVNGDGTRVRLPKKPDGFRDKLLVHSGRESNGNIENRPTAGCLRVDPDCQIAFNEWVRNNPDSKLKVEEVSNSSDAATNDRILLERIFR